MGLELCLEVFFIEQASGGIFSDRHDFNRRCRLPPRSDVGMVLVRTHKHDSPTSSVRFEPSQVEAGDELVDRSRAAGAGKENNVAFRGGVGHRLDNGTGFVPEP